MPWTFTKRTLHKKKKKQSDPPGPSPPETMARSTPWPTVLASGMKPLNVGASNLAMAETKEGLHCRLKKRLQTSLIERDARASLARHSHRLPPTELSEAEEAQDT